MPVAPNFLVGICNCGYVPDVNRHSVLNSHDRVPDLAEILKLAESPEQIFRMAADYVPAGKIQVFVAQPGDYLLDRDLHGLKLGAVDQDLYLPLAPAHNHCACHTVNHLYAVFYLVFDKRTEVAQVSVASDAVGNDRDHSRVKLDDNRVIDLGRQVVPDNTDTVTHILGGKVDIRAPLKFHYDYRKSLLRGGAYSLHVLDFAHRRVDRLGNERLYVFGGDTLIARDHGGHGIGEIRHKFDGESDKGDRTQDHNYQDKHQHRHWTAHGKFRYSHRTLTFQHLVFFRSLQDDPGAIFKSQVPLHNDLVPLGHA